MEKKPDPLKEQFDRTRKGLEEHRSFKNALSTVKLMSQAVQQLRDEGMDVTFEARPASITAPPFVRGTIGMEGREFTFTIGYSDRGGLAVELRNGSDVFATLSRDAERKELDSGFQSGIRTYLIQMKAATELYAQHDVGTGKAQLPKQRASGSLKP